MREPSTADVADSRWRLARFAPEAFDSSRKAQTYEKGRLGGGRWGGITTVTRDSALATLGAPNNRGVTHEVRPHTRRGAGTDADAG